MPKKAELPTKVCVRCGRPFAWRKKWARVWPEVKYCSRRCGDARPAFGNATAKRESRGLPDDKPFLGLVEPPKIEA